MIGKVYRMLNGMQIPCSDRSEIPEKEVVWEVSKTCRPNNKGSVSADKC